MSAGRAAVVVLIPAYHPDKRLPDYVRRLRDAGVENVVLVDDGSGDGYRTFFEESEKTDGVTVLTHPENRGKGVALKTGFAYIARQFPDCVGVVTADSDAQHTVEDILRIADELTAHPDQLVLGVRDFSREDVPPKSRHGNLLTVKVFRLLYGKTITDTQTGLRGIGRGLLAEMVSLKGSRFEYEMGMLIYVVRQGIAISEIPIRTIYHEENKSTHFRPIVDSVKIYAFLLGSFFKYLLSSLSASLIDLGCFTLFNLALFSGLSLRSNVFLSTILARVISSLYNFGVNRKVVFRAEGSIGIQALKYYALAALQMLCSAGLVYFFTDLLRFSPTVVKIVVDTVLFFISFQIQNRLIFGNRRTER